MLKNRGTELIETERLILRRFVPEDAKNFYDNVGSDFEVAKYVIWDVHKNIDVTKKLLEKWIASYDDPNKYKWAIELKENKEVVGSIDCVNLSVKYATCEVGYVLSSKYWNKGYMTETLKAVIGYLFEEGFKTIYAEYMSLNPASGRVMEKAGMKYEGTLKRRIIDKVSGKYDDLLSYSIFNE